MGVCFLQGRVSREVQTGRGQCVPLPTLMPPRKTGIILGCVRACFWDGRVGLVAGLSTGWGVDEPRFLWGDLVARGW